MDEQIAEPAVEDVTEPAIIEDPAVGAEGVVEVLDEPEAEPEKPRYRCGGHRRKDEDGRGRCSYTARYPWLGRCPGELRLMVGKARAEAAAAHAAGKGCGQHYDCEKVGKDAIFSSKHRATAASAAALAPRVYIPTGFKEVDLVLGGGIVWGTVYLLGGMRGSGKTSLLNQILSHVSSKSNPGLYASAEESLEDLQYTVLRVGAATEHVVLIGDMANIVDILAEAERIKARYIVIDSVSEMEFEDTEGDVGTISQIKSCARYCFTYAKKYKAVVFLIGHVTGLGDFAGGETLQHVVDVLCYIDSRNEQPMLNPQTGEPIPGTEGVREIMIHGKNRRGQSRKRALLEMTEEGKIAPLSGRLRRRLSQLELMDGDD